MAALRDVVMAKFDIEHFLGDWYILGTIGHIFHDKCQYAKLNITYKEKKVSLATICYGASGGSSSESAEVMVKDLLNPARLQVKSSFLRGWEDLNVYDTDYTSYAILGNTKGSLLWIMSRSERISYCEMDRLIKLAADSHGFNTAVLTVQFDRLTDCAEPAYKVGVVTKK